LATVPGVVGIDNQAPIYNPDGLWTIWGLHQIYRGQEGLNRYIPKVNDYVCDFETYTMYIVDELDEITYIPTLTQKNPNNMTGSFTETDILFGVGPGTPSDTYRMYIDKSVTPYFASVDQRLMINGSMTSYVKVFKGAVVTDDGEVISKVYDSNGVFVSENVQLELASIEGSTNYTTKSVPPFYVTHDLPDNEIVTVVAYSAAGHVVSKRQLKVEISTFVRAPSASKKYITGISLKSAFLNPTIDKQIDYPLNIPVNALNLIGVVQYNDGKTLELPVDGTKFTMWGLDQYLSSIIGQKYDLVLNYTLSADEASYSGSSQDGYAVSEPYTLVTMDPNNSYTVKLFCIPVFQSEALGYQLRWFLLNLDRNIYFDVSNLVVLSPATGAFDPKAYGVLQKKQVSLNLRQVSGTFKAFIHTQIVDITLNGVPNLVQTPWLVADESNPSYPAYGLDLKAERVANSLVNISAGITDFDEWRARVYNATGPLRDPRTEIVPPTPTHFQVTYNSTTTEFPMSDWNANLNIAPNIDSLKTITIRFIKRTAGGDLILAVAGMVITN
jgi:hypothetical protein